MSDQQHTPTPWEAVTRGHSAIVRTVAGACKVAEARSREPLQVDEINAAFIVKAVNSHDDLLKALRYCEAASNQPNVFKHAAAAIKRVEEATIKHSPSNPCRCSGPSWKPHDADCALWKVEAPA